MKRSAARADAQAIPGLPVLPAGNYYFANFKNTAKLDYIEVPVMLKYRARKDKQVGYYVNGGPYMGFLMKATTVTSGTSPPSGVNESCIAFTEPFEAAVVAAHENGMSWGLIGKQIGITRQGTRQRFMRLVAD